MILILRRHTFWVVLITIAVFVGSAEVAAGQALTDSAELFDRNPATREEAVRRLGSHGESALADLLRALFDDDRRVRNAAIEALTDVGGDGALEVLRAAVHDSDPRLRENVVYAARRIGGQAAETVVEMLLADPSEAVREAARIVQAELQTSPPSRLKTRRGSLRSAAGQTDVP